MRFANDSGSVAGRNADSVLPKLFSGDWIWQNRDLHFPPAERGLGNECGRVSGFFLFAYSLRIIFSFFFFILIFIKKKIQIATKTAMAVIAMR